jgi:large subunit ribosomal protein L23
MSEKSKKITVDSKAYKVLVEPWVTEATTRAAELNKYVFKVNPRATKKEVKQSVESVYGVTVLSVNTVTIHRKKRVRGRTIGWKAGYKKAIVTLKEGDNIEFFEGK